MKGLTEGRIVHYVLPHSEHCRSGGEHRPAIIVRVWREDEDIIPPENGDADLQVFTDCAEDFYPPHAGYYGMFQMIAISFDNDKKLPGTWHWIENA